MKARIGVVGATVATMAALLAPTAAADRKPRHSQQQLRQPHHGDRQRDREGRPGRLRQPRHRGGPKGRSGRV